jgi:hypothetical protein
MTATPKPPDRIATPTADLCFGQVSLPQWYGLWLLDRAFAGDVEAALAWLERFGGDGAIAEVRQEIVAALRKRLWGE